MASEVEKPFAVGGSGRSVLPVSLVQGEKVAVRGRGGGCRETEFPCCLSNCDEWGGNARPTDESDSVRYHAEDGDDEPHHDEGVLTP